ncbi:hypothetical protein B10767_00520 [Campylobacter jejuni]|nr:hypothetical protein [Campylobacter jejuni]MDQ6375509.1 hypothetical protein [Campylobacter jejuni]MDQ6383661.1 hypothetical protein [Campylobacter jejuni]BEK06408.1 hypothetical protein B10767_00520 [Campylobacter jejuni]
MYFNCNCVLACTYSVGLEDNSWHFLGLFIAVIMAVILQVMPFIAIVIVALSGITTTQLKI